MAVVVIETPNLTADQKSRIGERVITTFRLPRGVILDRIVFIPPSDPPVPRTTNALPCLTPL